MKSFSHLYRLPQEQIGFARFILEGYDNLAIISTVKAGDGLVRVWGPEAQAQEAQALMVSLGAVLLDINHEH